MQNTYHRKMSFSSLHIFTQIHKHRGYSLTTTLQVELQKVQIEYISISYIGNTSSNKRKTKQKKVQQLKDTGWTYSVREVIVVWLVILILFIPVLLEMLAWILKHISLLLRSNSLQEIKWFPTLRLEWAPHSLQELENRQRCAFQLPEFVKRNGIESLILTKCSTGPP